jgi:branched-subunit amino acid aminotransferase/4-amino-4-deoxychorismate lyase
MEIYFKNKFVNEDTPLVTVQDRSFRFGDGVFETVIIFNGKLYDWQSHEKRLCNGLEYFGLKIDAENIPDIAAELLKKNNVSEGYVRVIISRGSNSGGLGYKPLNAEPYMVMQTISSKLPELKPSKLIISATKAFYKLPCKVNSALHYVMALKEAADNNCDNALLLDIDGNICETATSNIFWVSDNILFTPSAELPFIPGTMREKVLRFWEGEVREGKFKIEELQSADEIFLSNVGMLISPVSEITGTNIKLAKTAVAKEIYDKIMAAIKA